MSSSEAAPLLSIRGLSKRFPVSYDWAGRPKSWLWAVDFVDLDVRRGETLALVGESGCGKTTLARLVLRLLPASAGSVRFDRTDVLAATDAELRRFRERAQIVFQDPFGSLDPRMRVEAIVGEALPVDPEPAGEVARMLELVGLPASAADRYPYQLSGGERQRVAIARALAVRPELLIADEPVSALDMPVRASVLNVLEDARVELGLTTLVIAHDLSVVRHVADRVAVMYLGRIVEVAPVATLFERPLHPYTQALVSSEPRLSRAPGVQRIRLMGDPRPPVDPAPGCLFEPRCFRALRRCAAETPSLDAVPEEGGRDVACFNFAPIGSPGGRESPERAEVVPARTRRDLRSALLRLVAKRVAIGIALLFVASAIIFTGLSSTPGFPRVGPEEAERLGLGEPVGGQYLRFLGNLLSGDPGSSLESGASIGRIVEVAGVNTVKLGLAAIVLVFALAVPLGVLTALRRNAALDGGIRLVTILAMGIPNFFLAVLLIQLFAVELRWLPVSGPGGFEHLILPAVVLSLESVGITIRLVRSAVVEELASEYVRALRGKGLREARVVWVHVLRNALAPVVALAGVVIPTLVGYSLVVEVIFRYEGLSYQLVQAILNRDYFLGTTLSLMFLAVVMLCNLAADGAQLALDPKARSRARA